MKFNNIERFMLLFAIFTLLFSCNEEYLEKFPKDKLSEGTFWSSEDDAIKALAGVYHSGASADRGDMWTVRGITWKENFSDNAIANESNQDIISVNANSENGSAKEVWKQSYSKITRCNYFLENIDRIEMDASTKQQYIAEVRYIRACAYFYMSQFFGGVPLVTNVLNLEDANSVARNTKEEVVNFVLTELTEAANDLPANRSDVIKGRASKAAALAFKGRLLLAEKRWSEAADVYSSIMGLGYSIDSRYQELFLEDGEDSPEIIFAAQYMEEAPSSSIASAIHEMYGPRMIGGQCQINPLHDLVASYEMTDGKSVEESNLFDPMNPYENRDPRLYYTVLLPNYSILNGKLFVSHPDSTNAADNMPKYNRTGYGLLKYIHDGYSGNFSKSGGDIPIIRYAEVLLSFLEAKLESGPVNQTLLDQTINLVRGRSSVGQPPITETDIAKLREIVRNERRIEFAFEGIRYWDLLRWRIAEDKLNGPIYGAKVCDGQNGCKYDVDEDGHYYVRTRDFDANKNYLWPIPQSDRNINPNLTQNPGF